MSKWGREWGGGERREREEGRGRDGLIVTWQQLTQISWSFLPTLHSREESVQKCAWECVEVWVCVSLCVWTLVPHTFILKELSTNSLISVAFIAEVIWEKEEVNSDKLYILYTYVCTLSIHLNVPKTIYLSRYWTSFWFTMSYSLFTLSSVYSTNYIS